MAGNGPSIQNVRPSSHNGLYYSQNPNDLYEDLEHWLGMAMSIEGSGARVILAPHDEYARCGATAAHAFKQIVPDNIRRIFILGPSHLHRLFTCALSTRTKYRTPFGNMNVDREVNDNLFSSGNFDWYDRTLEDQEHSIEMMLPFLAKVMESQSIDSYTIVPVVVGHINGIAAWPAVICDDNLETYGSLFAPYLEDPTNLFVISSDFGHWGVNYDGFAPFSNCDDILHKIREMDREGMDAISSLDPAVFNDYLKRTKYAICGRDAICVLMQAIDSMRKSDSDHTYEWRFLEYDNYSERDVYSKDASHVSYAAGALVIHPRSVTGAYTIASEKQDMTAYTIRVEVQAAFANWINSNLSLDSDLSNLLPIILEGGDLYHKIDDGLIICKLINLAVPGTVDERAINKKNLILALMSAQAIGCNIVNIDCHDLSRGSPLLVLGLLWQIIRIGLFSQIDLKHVPGLFRLLRDGETLEDLRRLSPEEKLMRWVNYHMQNAGVDRRLKNFTSDINDSEIYTHLLHQIAPRHAGVTLSPLERVGNLDRAGAMLCEAEKLDCREFVTPNGVASGNYKLNLAFVANLFNKHPNLPEPGADEMVDMEDVVAETREEKTYSNWMNSMGVDPYVNWLYSDLTNGLTIFQLYDIIRPGIVDWKRVVKVFKKEGGMTDAIKNCNYAVELGKQLRFSLVGIQGKDIYDGNQTLTLGLVWQLMRAYTLTILAQCTQCGDALPADKDIIQWVNQKLKSAGSQLRIKSFMDSSISNGKVVLDLVNAINPNVVDWSLVRDDSMDNAKYAIACARKIGAKVYALPEDIVEVKPKMVLTLFACLMARDFE